MLLGIIYNRKKHLVDELQSVTHMYLEGVAEHVNVQPVLIPCPMENGTFDAAPILERVDGILMTGSTSNVHPSRYGMEETEAHHRLIWRAMRQHFRPFHNPLRAIFHCLPFVAAFKNECCLWRFVKPDRA